MTLYNVVSPGALVAGQPEDVSVLLANLQAIATVLNGNLDNGNINAAAAIAISKLQGYPSDGTKLLRGDGTWALPTTAYGTTLPASPVDGQEAILVDSVTNPTYLWRFRYNAGSTSPYKWEYVGGTPWVWANNTSSNNPGTSSADAGYGTIFTIPRAGDYVCELEAEMYSEGQGYYSAYLAFAGATKVSEGGTIFLGKDSAIGDKPTITSCRPFRVNGIAASAAVQIWHDRFGLTVAHLQGLSATITPARVS